MFLWREAVAVEAVVSPVLLEAGVEVAAGAEAEVSTLTMEAAETASGPESPVVAGEEEVTAEGADRAEDITMAITST